MNWKDVLHYGGGALLLIAGAFAPVINGIPGVHIDSATVIVAGLTLLGIGAKADQALKVVALVVFGGWLLAVPASAASFPTKAPLLSAAYPASSGFYFGLGTMGGGGSVAVSAPGVNSNSVVTNQIGVGGIVGYARNVPNSQLFAAVEGWFGWNNVNGSAPGFSFSGPASFTQRVMIGAPLADIAAVLPTSGLPAVPPFPTPGGQTATNIKPYIAASLSEDDITIDIAGHGSNRDWRLSPGISVGALGQLSSGSVVDVFAMTQFPQKGVCVGAGTIQGQACGSQSTVYKAGLALKW